MSDPRLAIIGAGGLSTRRIYANIGAAGAQLVGVCDLDSERAERNARRFGGEPYADWREMLEAQRPDAVIICIGPEMHAQLAPEVLRAGYPVYTEKPPAPTAAEALAVARTAKDCGLLCTTAFKKRYAAAYVRAREWIAGFPTDELLSLSIDYASAHYPNNTPRFTFLLDFAIHVIDLAGYLFGEAARVFAFTKDQHAFAVSIEFASGAVGSLNLTDGRSFAVPTEEVEITVRGGNFMTIHNSSVWRLTEGGECSEWREPPTFVSSGDSGNDTGHLAEIVDFVEALRQGRPTRSNIAESYRSMVLYEAIRDAAATGEPVQVTYEQV